MALCAQKEYETLLPGESCRCAFCPQLGVLPTLYHTDGQSASTLATPHHCPSLTTGGEAQQSRRDCYAVCLEAVTDDAARMDAKLKAVRDAESLVAADSTRS